MRNFANSQPTSGNNALTLSLGVDLSLVLSSSGESYLVQKKISIIELIAVDIGWESI